MKTVIVTGGTGNIGTALCKMLTEKGYRVIIFTRSSLHQKNYIDNVEYIRWNPADQQFDSKAISETDVIINLAGAGIANGRWTKKRMRQIYESRINSDRTIVKALKEVSNKVSVVINASAIGYYGKGDGIRSFEEDEIPGKSFLSHVCKDWEEKIEPVSDLGKRLVILRTGMVLDSKGGGYPKITSAFKYRFGILIGTGREMMSWIHITDLCRLYLYAIENENLSGVFNACSPNPVTGKEFMSMAGMVKAGKSCILIPTPASVLRLLLGKVVDEAILQNVRVTGKKIIAAGFQFTYPTIKQAIISLESKSHKEK